MLRSGWLAAVLMWLVTVAGPAWAKDDLVIGVSNFPSSMHPNIDPAVVKGYIEAFALRPVTAFGTDWKNGCLLCIELPSQENGLARIEQIPGGKPGMAVTVKLKPDLFWADGVPMTARDLAFTARVGADPNSGFANTKLWGKVKSVDVVNDHTAVMHLSEISSQFDRIPQILPEHIEGPVYEHAGGPGEYIKATVYNRAPTTPGLWSGPWMVTGYQSSAQIILDLNPFWKGEKPGFKRVVIRDIENTAALQANLLSGDIDMTPGESIGLTIDQVLDLRKQQPDRFTYIFKPSLTYDKIDFQLSNPILKDVRVRRAMLYAIDRQAMTDKLFEGMLPIAATWVNPLEPNFSKDTATYPYDPAKARALLTEAGWTPGADGICRDGAGQRLSVELRGTSGIRLRELQEAVIQSEFKAVCIEAVLKGEPFRTLFGETMKHRHFDMVLYSWISQVDDTPRQTLASDQIPTEANVWSGSNYAGFSNAQMDADISTVETDLDPEKRHEAFVDMQKIYADQLPSLPLFFRAEAHAVPKWLRGYAPTGHGDYGALHAEDWHAE